MLITIYLWIDYKLKPSDQIGLEFHGIIIADRSNKLWRATSGIPITTYSHLIVMKLFRRTLSNPIHSQNSIKRLSWLLDQIFSSLLSVIDSCTGFIWFCVSIVHLKSISIPAIWSLNHIIFYSRSIQALSTGWSLLFEPDIFIVMVNYYSSVFLLYTPILHTHLGFGQWLSAA